MDRLWGLLRMLQYVSFLTKKRGFKPPFLKGIIKKMSDFKLGPFKAEPIQNRSTERLRPELVEGSRRSPKSKIQNRVTEGNPAR
jgi:hypothetical protein